MELAIVRAAQSLFQIFDFLIIANALLSWFPFVWQNPTLARFARVINRLTEPLLKPVRKLLAKTPVGDLPIDISPVIAILLLRFLQNILVIILLAVI